MARTGLYLSDVKKARDSLLSQGKHPSVDAVRVALGNTGSKTTIHKYLKELDAAEGERLSGAPISDAIQDLVARLSAQLQAEADAVLQARIAEWAQKEVRLSEANQALQQELAAAARQAETLDEALQVERANLAHANAALQQETIARHTAQQQLADLRERLGENEKHLQSLEEKHQHSRDALEHYRASVKEQRDADLRRHEQQVQELQSELRMCRQGAMAKQDDVTRLNAEGARLVSELSHANRDLHEAREHGRQLVMRVEALQASELRCRALESALRDRDAQLMKFSQERDAARAAEMRVSEECRQVQLDLATARATLEAQAGTVAALREAFVEQGRAGKRPKHSEKS